MTLRAMLFDLDGTITRPLLDFATIKREMGLPADAFILEALAVMAPPARARAEAVLQRHEDQAAAQSELNDGVTELLRALAAREVATGIITRNSRRSLAMVLARHSLEFTTLICREDAAPKPLPDGLLKAMANLRVQPAAAVYVGDHRIDVQAGTAAGTRTIWVTNGHPATPRPPADYEVAHPAEIIPLLELLSR